jgi:hypothetical protein
MGGKCFQVRRAFTKSMSYKLSGIPAMEMVPGTILMLSSNTEDCFAEIIFLRRFDPGGVAGRGFWAAASSQPTDKQMHSIRFFPINNL